jgi:hypothetical protein
MLKNMKARMLRRSREEFSDGTIVEVVIWELPAPMTGCRHRFKYRLYCGRNGICVVRYDNERRKGDHRHQGDREEKYRFVSMEKLIDDFLADVERLTGAKQ